MAKLGLNELKLQGEEGIVWLKRDHNGIPVIKANAFSDMYYGLGWIHANDRFLNMELSRIIGQGRGAELLSPELLKLDLVMRRNNLYADSVKEAETLSEETACLIQAYLNGVNRRLNDGPLPFEFKLLKHKPAPYRAADLILGLKLIGFVDLTETQGFMEKWIIQLIQQGYLISELRELFPYLCDEPDPEFLEIIKKVRLTGSIIPETVSFAQLPRLQGSNNWAVSGKKTASGQAMLCSDPHLDTSRLPAIWQEVVLSCGHFYFAGATVPGIPGLPLGRSNHLAWSPTYGNMDVIDYFIEEVKGGKYRRGNRFIPFTVREEELKVKNSTSKLVRFYETDHGVLEEEPAEEGFYLCFSWAGARSCGAESIESMVRLPEMNSVDEALPHFSRLDFGSFNWVAADRDGNIGYQMSGRCPIRKKGSSGILPLPGWDKSFAWQGYYDRTKNPGLYNPESGYIATANNDLNSLGEVPAINLTMAPYRIRRIEELLQSSSEHSVASMQKMHYDIYSTQAADFMKVINPLLPGNEKGILLADWDCCYSSKSKAPVLFEKIYRELFRLLFGKFNFGETVLDYLLEDTVLLHDYYYHFDTVLLNPDSVWYRGKSQEEVFTAAISRAFAHDVENYGDKRQIMLRHLLLGGRVPKFLGFDYGPVEMPGGRATISISQIFKSEGREATFSPTYRFITDLAEDKAYSVLAGGPTDRRFSPWYVSGVKGWLSGRYKELIPPQG